MSVVRKALSSLAMGAALLAPLAAQAAESPLWEKVGPWQVRVDPTMGNGCFMLAGYGNGTALRVGVNVNAGKTYVMLVNDAWASLEAGKTYSLTVTIDDGQPSTWEALAEKIGDGITLHTQIADGSSAWRQLAAHNVLKIYYQGNMISALRLTGSVAAVESVTRCQAAFVAAAAKPADPFKAAPQPAQAPAKRDPFA
jgi:hypothetical protein